MIYPAIVLLGIAIMYCILRSFDMLIGAMFPNGVSYTLVQAIKTAYGFTVSLWWASLAVSIFVYGGWVLKHIYS